jgi:hypothetical protein
MPNPSIERTVNGLRPSPAAHVKRWASYLHTLHTQGASSASLGNRMKVREVVIFTGERFEVPQGIQRLDHRATHGWQLRYGGTKMFSDHTQDGFGASVALEHATKELLKRIAKLPAPSKLQSEPNESKTTDLPVGISGPIVRLRKGAKVRECSLSVSLPQFGKTPRRRSVYIGTENTYTVEKYNLALAKAIKLRELVEEAYQHAATQAKRAEGRVLRAKRSRSASAT